MFNEVEVIHEVGNDSRVDNVDSKEDWGSRGQRMRGKSVRERGKIMRMKAEWDEWRKSGSE